MILLEPCLRNLREARRSAEITVVVDDGYGDVLRTCAWVDEAVELPVAGPLGHRLGLWWNVLRRIGFQRFDVAFDLACLLLYLPTLASADEQAFFLEHYARAAGLLGPATGSRRWKILERRARRTRARLLAAMRRRGRSSPPLPAH